MLINITGRNAKKLPVNNGINFPSLAINPYKQYTTKDTTIIRIVASVLYLF